MVLEDVSLEVCFEFISTTSVDTSPKALQFTATEPAKSSSPTVSDARTPRAIACGILLDLTVSLACMYFGLHAGTVNAMYMQSALLGSAILGAIQHRFSTSQPPVAPPRSRLLRSLQAGALGLAPSTSGFTSFPPALEFPTGDEDGPSVRFSLPQLLLWSLTIYSLRIVAAAPFRRLFIHREPLRFPSATATGTLISILFGRPPAVTRAEPDDSSSSSRPVYRSVVTDPPGPTEHESPTGSSSAQASTPLLSSEPFLAGSFCLRSPSIMVGHRAPWVTGRMVRGDGSSGLAWD